MATRSADDYYALLGVEVDADESTLRSAWRRLALQWHPDRAGSDSTATFQQLSAAYAVLSDPMTRAAYDRRHGSTSRVTERPSEPVAARPKAPGVMLRRLTGSLDALLACGLARRIDGGTIELIINEQEATQGGMVTISMRVSAHCTACSVATPSLCTRCGGRRVTDELFSAWLAVPPGVADGTVLAPSVQLRGVVRPVSFRIRLRDAL